MTELVKNIKDYFSNYNDANYVFDELLQIGDVYIIGGLLREYRDCCLSKIGGLRDADFAVRIVDKERWLRLLDTFPNKRNRFGGHKFVCADFVIDIWDVSDTWAIKEKYVSVKNDDYVSALSNSVFLSIDSIIYDVKRDQWVDSIYRKSMDTKVLDVVLENNPYIPLNVIRAIILKNKYKMTYSEHLKDIIEETSRRVSIVDELCLIQLKRYGKLVIDSEDIISELKSIQS